MHYDDYDGAYSYDLIIKDYIIYSCKVAWFLAQYYHNYIDDDDDDIIDDDYDDDDDDVYLLYGDDNDVDVLMYVANDHA